MTAANTERFTFALVTETNLVRPRELQLLAVPLERNAQHCAAEWQVPSPAVVIAEPRKVPRHLRPVVFLSEDSRDTEALAVHYVDPVTRGPAARVYVDRTSGFYEGPFSTGESAAHEILEMIANPYLRNWYPYPIERSSGDVEVAGENADPCQDTYVITHAGTKWQVANFVTPKWFASNLARQSVGGRATEAAVDAFLAGGGRFDYMRRLRSAGEIGPEGFAVLRSRQPDGKWLYWNEPGWARKARGGPQFASVRARARVAHAHPWSRTNRLLRGAEGV